jgi:hypothetical protein
MCKAIAIEPIPLSDTFCMGIAKIEIIGPNARFFMYSDQASLNDAGIERVIVAKFVLPVEAIPKCIKQALDATASHTVSVIVNQVRGAMEALH